MNRKTIGNRIRELRGDRKREEIAVACGVTAQAISMYECGRRVPNDDIKVRLATCFGVSVQALFYDEE